MPLLVQTLLWFALSGCCAFVAVRLALWLAEHDDGEGR